MPEWCIAIISTVVGAVLGWSLQLIKSKKVIIAPIKIKPLKSIKYIRKAYFKINVFNSSDKCRALRDLKIVFVDSKGKQFEYPPDVEYCKEDGYVNEEEREEYEVYANPIRLVSLSPQESKELHCKIEFDNNDLIAGAHLEYKNEKFKIKRQDIILEIDKNEEQNNG